MKLWKLGCRWGSGTPLFYDFIKENNIVIGWIDKDYKVGDWILITDGFSVLDIANVKSVRKSVLDFPQYKLQFEDLKIPYDNDIFIYDVSFLNIDIKDRFSYSVQQGIVRVHDPETIIRFNEIKKRYEMKKGLEMKRKLLEYKKQIILQGPPGTGKTREAKLITKEMIGVSDVEDLTNHEQFKIVQFHPSYTYEDFVRGIATVPNGNSIEYQVVDRGIAEFANQALENYNMFKKEPSEISKAVWVRDNYLTFKESLELDVDNEEEVLIKEGSKAKIIAVEEDSIRVNRYSNENDKILIKDNDIILGYIGLYLKDEKTKIKDNIDLSKSARSGMYYLYQNMVDKFASFLSKQGLSYSSEQVKETVELRNFVLVIDEINRANLSSVLGELIYALEYRGNGIEGMYSKTELDKIILPPNLYIIGTMNTADRSVGHIDYAIRRRFAFVDVLPEKLKDNDEIFFNGNDFDLVSALFTKEYVSDEFDVKDIQIGHSYFIVKKKEAVDIEAAKEIFTLKMKYEVLPILREYLKDGVFKEIVSIKIEELETKSQS